MKESQAGKAMVLTGRETLRGDALVLLGYCCLFGAAIAAVLAMHGLPVP